MEAADSSLWQRAEPQDAKVPRQLAKPIQSCVGLQVLPQSLLMFSSEALHRMYFSSSEHDIVIGGKVSFRPSMTGLDQTG